MKLKIQKAVKKYMFIVAGIILLLSSSCQNEERVMPTKGKAAFAFSSTARNNGRTAETATPAFVLLSIKDSHDNVQENIKLPLFTFGESYLSENIELETGDYQLTQFVVLDASHKAIYATPLEGSELAGFVTEPLSIDFTITNEGTQITPQVLAVLEDDRPQTFGFASFDFKVVSNSSVVLINARVVIDIGGVLYENLDANVRIKGYAADNTTKWVKDYDFIGPVDVLEVKNGFHHYSIELVDKWGIHDIQKDIPAKDIWDGRADGPLPATYGLSGVKEAKKLLRYVTSFEVNSPNGIIYQPSTRDIIAYNNDGTINHILYEVYNLETLQFQGSYVDAFVYDGKDVSKITRTLDTKLYVEYHYTYGLEDKITVKNYATGITSTQIITRNWLTDNSNNSVSVHFSSSNGSSFLYQFNIDYKNNVSDKTIKSGELCNQGNYTYDKNINPFSHLGYLDYNFQNWSINNTLTEQVEYLACGFPELIPVSHSYIYDLDGYPVQKITTYTTGHHSKTDFLYK